MTIADELLAIVGKANFIDDPKGLQSYSQDFSLVPPSAPNYAVIPKSSQQVEQIVQAANRHPTPLVPLSSRVHFYGATIPEQGGVVVDLSQMNRILEIDDENRRIRIEPGATWEQVQAELEKHELRVVTPLLPHGQRSVVTDYLERSFSVEPIFEYSEPILTTEVIWPSGELFRTGSASTPGYPESEAQGLWPLGPGLDFWRLLLGAQGTMGIVTWANLKTEYLPKANKTFFMPFQTIDAAIEPIYKIQRRRMGHECLLLNSILLASILAEDWPGDFERLRATLPPWTLILILSGSRRRPEERIDYEEKALREIARQEFPYLELLTGLPGAPRAARELPDRLRKPWPSGVPYWKQRYRGGCQDLFFVTKPAYAGQFVQEAIDVVARHDYTAADLGCYLQPIEYARACHLEFNLFYNPNDAREVARTREAHKDLAQAVFESGAFFNRPYGDVSKVAFNGADSGYVAFLKQIKKIFDPKQIMNPGKLCF